MNIVETLSLATLAGILALSSAMAQPIRLVGDDNAPPQLSLVNGVAQGSVIDVLRKIGVDAKLDFRFDLQPWARSLDAAMKDEVGIIGLSWTPERALLFDYSEPIHFSEIILVVKKGSEFAFNTLGDLKGKRIGAQLDASYGGRIDQEFRQSQYHIERSRSLPARLEMLLLGRLDAVIVVTGRPGLELVLASNPHLLAQRQHFVVLRKPLVRDPEYLAFRKDLGKKDLLAKINAALPSDQPR